MRYFFTCILCLWASLLLAQNTFKIKTNIENDSLVMGFDIAMKDLNNNLRKGKTRLTDRMSEAPLLEAGADYDQPWTRDISINTINGTSFWRPEAIKRTLWAVCEHSSQNDTLIGGQYWDNMIWALGAEAYYRASQDEEFLSRAWPVITRTLKQKESLELDQEKGLFRGGAIYGDGVSAYDARYTDTGEYTGTEWNCTITKWVEHNPKLKSEGGGLPMMVLSTNVMYYQVYQTLATLAKEKDLPNDGYQKKAKALKKAIQQQFWNKQKQTFNYYIDPWGVNDRQEGLGISMLLLTDIPTQKQRQAIFENIQLTTFGLPCVYPSYDRYNQEGHYSRHAGTVWGHILGFWGSAALHNAQEDLFIDNINIMAKCFIRDGECREIYHPDTGLPYGGLQEDGFKKGWIREWESTHEQTWTATGYLRLFLFDIFGLTVKENGLYFKPNQCLDRSFIELEGLRFAEAELNIRLQGKGQKVKSVFLDDEKVYFIPKKLKGKHQVRVVLEGDKGA
ncbi:MGH1-like glycoside hydrolase domain-containing protein [Persicobacter diffluens]|uniref:Mannosylglycerate hydrolase MGH1-like glycoside hydrolase domain-containing protein n=1 Tax=Persicobacter diffluens TaxID=981 RepID=A0AAN4W398_9BACT|nr:hypothetical protein PEDI_46510 [Persicobacter diffluens]